VQEDKQDLVEVTNFSLPLPQAMPVHAVKWHPAATDSVLLADSRMVTTWAIKGSSVEQVCRIHLADDDDGSGNGNGGSSMGAVGGAVWDPHSPSTCVASHQSDLHFLDVRKMEITTTVKQAHGHSNIRDVDYNPNKPLTVITAGDDRKVRFWDVRNLKSPIKTLAGHSHSVCCVKYNPFHDQLLVSGGSDNIVNLWRIASCSSAPWIGSDEMDVTSGSDGSGDSSVGQSKDPPDVKVRAIDQHEDSVYGVAWSPADAWMYCSLSFDGRVILNHVPSTEKYKILL